MFERFTDSARKVVVEAQRQARELHSTYIGTEHLLLGLLAETDGVAAAVLREVDLTLDDAREQVRLELRGIGAREATAADDALALEVIGIDLPTVRARLDAAFGPGAWERAQRRPPSPTPLTRWRRWRRRAALNQCDARGGGPRVSGHVPFTRRAKKVLELSLREALTLQHRYIGTEHLLLGLLREGQGLGARVLAARGIDAASLRRRVLAALDEAA